MGQIIGYILFTIPTFTTENQIAYNRNVVERTDRCGAGNTMGDGINN